MHFRSHKKINGIKIILYAGILLLVVLLILLNGMLFRLAAVALQSVTLPRAQELESLPKHILAARVADNEKELARVRYQALLYEAVANENIRLKELLDLSKTENVSFGNVVSRPPQTLYDTLLVRVSDSRSISEGEYVFFNELFIGKVSRIEGNSVLVTLFSNPGAVLDVRVGEPKAVVTLHGLGGGAFVFSVSNEIELSPGDLVTSVLSDTFVVGVVGAIQIQEDSTNKTVFVHNAVSFADIDFVSFRSPLTELP